MSGKILNTIVLAFLIVTPAFTATLPSFKGSIKVTEFIEKDIEAVLMNSHSPMIRNLQTLISISLKEGKFDAIMDLMKEILDDLHDDKAEENSGYGLTKSGLTEQISNYNTAWTTAEKLRDSAKTKADALRSEIAGLKTSIDGLNSDIKEVIRLELGVENRWTADQAAY